MRFNQKIPGLSVALLLAGCGPKAVTSIPLPAGVIVVASTQRYRVEGATAAAIGRSMRANAPPSRSGAPWLGLHTWNLRWTYRMVNTPTSCRFENVQVEIQTTIQVPDWQRPADAPALLRSQWDAFIAALDEHERGHERIAVIGAGEVATLLRRLQEVTCMTLQNEAQRQARELMGLIGERQAAFDTETQHGIRTGARWPPPVLRDST